MLKATNALVEYADEIPLALDEANLKARGVELDNERRKEAERAARYIENEKDGRPKLRGSHDTEPPTPQDGGSVQ